MFDISVCEMAQTMIMDELFLFSKKETSRKVVEKD